ncbi:DMP19 family protein [Nocardia rhizosphaerae]|uniref:DNA mimic protein DMP19 C-terminal domain-containing protein n=1 Tax=Nocardia rhizosphaerae TaxID=1691571 RepID=A0ABV8L3Q0_9NOCA
MDYRFPARARDSLAAALAGLDSIHDAADLVFWSNPVTAELQRAGVGAFAELPPAFAHLLALSSLHATVLDTGFSGYLRTRGAELPWATRGLRAAGMPRLAAAAILAARDAAASGPDDDLERFFDDEHQTLANPAQIRRPDGARADDPDEIYDINEPEDFERRVLDYLRTNLHDFVRES